MMRRFAASAGFVVLGTSVGRATYPKKLGLSHYLTPATRGVANCGTFRFELMRERKLNERQLAELASCIRAARDHREGFGFSVEGPGIDSYLATGLVGAADGTVQRFCYDSAPCGGPQCPERFVTRPCTIAPDVTVIDPNMDCGSR